MNLEKLDMTGCRGDARALEKKVWAFIAANREAKTVVTERPADSHAERLLEEARKLREEAQKLREKAAELERKATELERAAEK